MLKLSSSLLIALTLVSCGKKSGDSKPGFDQNRYSSHPIPLTSARSNKAICSVTQFDDIQRHMTLSLFMNGQEAEVGRNFVGMIDGLLVRDIGAKSITESQKGQKTLYDYLSEDGVVSGRKEELSAPSRISVCPDDGTYPRGTIESAALNASYFINKTSTKIKELAPEVNIAPITLKISPLIKKKITVKKNGEVTYTFEAYETDNAYYMPSENTITFLPHSEEFRKAGVTMNFWDVPMVASHEFGHHVFESIFPTEEKSASHKGCFGKFGINEETTTNVTRKVTNEEVVYALNEGFADLVSFYTLENSERGLQGVPCLEIARDVGANVFADGTPKVFSERALAEFFAEKESEGPATCDVPNFQDIHIVGAVFANGADRLLALNNINKSQKMKIVLKWLQAMKTRKSEMNALSPRDFLRKSFELFVVTTAEQTDGKVDPAECSKANDTYPGIADSLLACRPQI